MNILAFDCSLRFCSASLVVDGDVRARAEAPPALGQAEALVPLLVSVLEQASLGWKQIDLIAATVGPGSFTGLRIGLAAARGLCLGGNIPFAGITTFAAYAHALPEAERLNHLVLVVLDAKRAELFVQPFSERLEPLGEPMALVPEAIAGAVAQFGGQPVLLAGDAASMVAPHFSHATLSAAIGAPDTVTIAHLARQRFAAGTALPPVPLYIRAPDVTLAGG